MHSINLAEADISAVISGRRFDPYLREPISNVQSRAGHAWEKVAPFRSGLQISLDEGKKSIDFDLIRNGMVIGSSPLSSRACSLYI